MSDELAEHLDTLARDACHRVDAVLKRSSFETTERVFFRGENGAELGPFVRKIIDRDSGIGSAYESIYAAQRAGRRFRYLPGIIECHEAGGSLVVVMEYVGGETLADVVYRCDPSLALACDVFPRLCEAVTELHEGFDPPLIHRDLKPSNVMLSRDSMTIIDFGIARAYKEDSEEDTRHFGTRAYAPPEQFGFGQTDVRSDVYALGMLLYFCLTEKIPDQKVRRAGFADARLPEDLRSVIVRATAFDPADRYASASELKEAFEDAVSSRAARAMSAYAAASNPMPAQASAYQSTQIPTSPSLSVPAPVPAPTTFTQPVQQKLRFAERVPFWLGVVWDGVLALTLALFVWVAFSLTADPTPGSSMAAESFAYRAVGNVAIVFFIIAPVLFVVRDRRPLRRWVPFARECKRKTELLFIAGGFVVCMLIFAILSALGI